MAEIKSGYVHKCGNTVKSWKRRWFVLKANGYLYYYEDKSSKQEKGKIDLVDASKVGEWKEISTVNRKLPSGFSSSNAFGIVAGDRTFTCVCENDGESQSWLAAFARVRNPDNQEYPEPTYPKEKQTAPEPEAPPVQVKKELPLSAAKPAPVDVPYGGSLPRHSHISQPPPEEPVMSNTLPRAKARPAPPPPEPMPSVPATNPYYTPEVRDKLASQPPQAPPPAYQPQAPPPQYGGPPPQQYRPPPPQQPCYRPPPPQQYPPQQQYRPPPQPQYRPPPQPQYRPPPQQYYRPAQPQYRPPPQPQYRQPPPQAYYPPGVRGPYASQPRPPPPPVQTVQRQTTTVTVVTVPAQQRVVHRRR